MAIGEVTPIPTFPDKTISDPPTEDVPMPTLPVDGNMENDPLEVDMDGVVPVNLKALLLPDNVKVEKVGVPVVVISWAAFKVTLLPSDTNPPPVSPVPAVTVRDELDRYEFRIDELGRDNPDVTVNDPPILTLPDVLNVPNTSSVYDGAELATPTLPPD